MPDTVNVQIRYSVDVPNHGSFSDALYYSVAEYLSLDKAAVEQEKQKRVDAWILFLKQQAELPPKTYTIEELVALKQSLLQDKVAQAEQYDSQVAEVDAKLIELAK